MEGLSATVCRGLKGYWRRRRSYQRLNKKPLHHQQLGGRKRRFWHGIKISPRRRLKIINRLVVPKRFIMRLRDSYVNFMFRIASSGGITAGNNLIPGGVRPGKEYEEKMIIEIYKALVAAQGSTVTTHHI